jgi:UPF0755 protein
VKILRPNANLQGDKNYFYVHSNWNYEDVVKALVDQGVVKNEASFRMFASLISYDDNIHPGKYRIEKGMNNYSLVRLLRSGKQEPVKLVIKKFRTLDSFVSAISSKLEVDSNELVHYLTDDAFLREYGLNKYSSLGLFIPNTYEFYWNTSCEKFISRMKKEFEQFWNEERQLRAKRQGLSPNEVITLASIVEEETESKKERPLIARVYLNRLRANEKLQADPTARFAAGDFTIKRVDRNILTIKSPYNTYMNVGLPIGPICIPSISSIESVLSPSEHNYMFFCASEKLDGTHNFAISYNEHLKNAHRYHEELNRRGIK